MPPHFHVLRAQPVYSERVSIVSGDHRIDGLLTLPKSRIGPVPVIIFLGGSGEWEIVDSYLRNPKESYANFLSFYLKDFITSERVGFLYLNKRGMGKSTGKYGRSDLYDRADDAMAAIDFLKQRKDVDHTRIGMIGHSQGGWVVQIAASRRQDFAFAISFAGPTVGVKQQTYTDYKNQFDCRYGTGSRKSVRKFKMKKLELGVGASIGRVLGGSAAEYARMVKYSNDETLKQIKVPTLLLFGEKDNFVPAKENMDYLNNVFNGHVPEIITTWSGAQLNHAFHEVESPCTDYMQSLQNSESVELREYLNRWLGRYLKVAD